MTKLTKKYGVTIWRQETYLTPPDVIYKIVELTDTEALELKKHPEVESVEVITYKNGTN